MEADLVESGLKPGAACPPSEVCSSSSFQKNGGGRGAAIDCSFRGGQGGGLAVGVWVSVCVGSFLGLCVSLSVSNVHWLRCGCTWLFVVQFL